MNLLYTYHTHCHKFYETKQKHIQVYIRYLKWLMKEPKHIYHQHCNKREITLAKSKQNCRVYCSAFKNKL